MSSVYFYCFEMLIANQNLRNFDLAVCERRRSMSFEATDMILSVLESQEPTITEHANKILTFEDRLVIIRRMRMGNFDSPAGAIYGSKVTCCITHIAFLPSTFATKFKSKRSLYVRLYILSL
jgi:hypothetical protein